MRSWRKRFDIYDVQAKVSCGFKPLCPRTQASKAGAPHTVRNRCRWSDDEDVRLVRLVMDEDYRASECGTSKLRWDLVSKALGRWSADGHTVRQRYSLLEHWTGARLGLSLHPTVWSMGSLAAHRFTKLAWESNSK